MASVNGGKCEEEEEDEDEEVVRTTEISFGQVKWNLTDSDGQLNIAQFEMKKFFYEKVRGKRCCIWLAS